MWFCDIINISNLNNLLKLSFTQCIKVQSDNHRLHVHFMNMIILFIYINYHIIYKTNYKNGYYKIQAKSY